MTPSFILLSKVGAGGGIIGLIVTLLVILYCLRREDSSVGSNGPNGIQQFFGGLAFGLSQRYEDYTADTANKKQFDYPPSLLLKISMALNGIALWIFVIIIMAEFDVSFLWIWLWGIFMPFFYVYLYMLWLRLFFVWLGSMRTPTAIVLASVCLVLLVVFWVVAIKAHQYYTSLEFLKQYWARKYGLH